MAEPLPEAPTPKTSHEPTEQYELEAETARRNLAWGWALFALFWALFGGTFGIAYLWIWLS
ncbi:MAG TPA: hypothetical protein VF186_09215 [Gaiellaceae bacterium]|jgi:hypothetical protein